LSLIIDYTLGVTVTREELTFRSIRVKAIYVGRSLLRNLVRKHFEFHTSKIQNVIQLKVLL